MNTASIIAVTTAVSAGQRFDGLSSVNGFGIGILNIVSIISLLGMIGLMFFIIFDTIQRKDFVETGIGSLILLLLISLFLIMI